MDAFRTFVERTGRAELARRLGVSTGMVGHWLCGRKRVTEAQALKIEQESGGLVAVEELRPDVPWHVIRGKPAHRVPITTAEAKAA